MLVDLAPVLWDRRVYANELAERLAEPPAPLREAWGDRVEQEAARGRMAHPKPTPRKG